MLVGYFAFVFVAGLSDSSAAQTMVRPLALFFENILSYDVQDRKVIKPLIEKEIAAMVRDEVSGDDTFGD